MARPPLRGKFVSDHSTDMTIEKRNVAVGTRSALRSPSFDNFYDAVMVEL